MSDYEFTLGEAMQMANNVDVSYQYNDLIDPSQNVGRHTVSSWNGLVRQLFTKNTLNTIKNKVSFYLQGVDKQGRTIVPSDKVIVTALYGVYQNHIPQTGDIYGRFLVVDPTQRNDYSYIVDKTISLLVRGIKTEEEMIQQNEKLTVWTTILGDFNDQGLRSHDVLKIREKRPDPYLFNMNY